MTIYNDSTLFPSECLRVNDGEVCNGRVISHVAVTSINGQLRDESVNVTFENIVVRRQ